MELYAELKLRGDAHAGGFSNGLTMCGSQSAKELKKISESEEAIVFGNGRGHSITVNKRPRGDALEVSTTFVNVGKESAVLEMLSSFALRGVRADKIYRIQSFWSAEGKLKAESVSDLQLEPSWNGCGMRAEKFGTLGSMPVRKYFPFVALEDGQRGEVIGIQLYIPSSWQMEILCREDETLSVTGGIADRDFGHWFKELAPGEAFTTPRAVIAQGASLDEVCDKLVKAQNPDVSAIDGQMGIAFNEYCTTWGNPSFDNVKKICGKLKGKGIQYLVIDSGWYGNDDCWWNCIGDWEENRQKFPGGLKRAAEYIRSCGMVPGIWFEFESLGKMSKYYEAAEHLLKKDGTVITVGEKRFWDMKDPWVTEYLSQKIIRMLKECGFGYLKVDYNDTIGIGCDGAESLGEGLRQRLEATQDFFRKIKREIPDIVIENCSSGGHRLEPSMMELVSQASFSDAHEIVSIPVIAANLQRVIPPSQSQIWAVMRRDDDERRICYSVINTFLGRMCLSGDIYDLTDDQWKVIDEGIAFYKKAADVIRYGKTVKLECSVKSYNRPKGQQIVIREFKNRRLVIAHRFEDSEKIPTDFLEGYDVLEEFGQADSDFSARAWLLQAAPAQWDALTAAKG